MTSVTRDEEKNFFSTSLIWNILHERDEGYKKGMYLNLLRVLYPGIVYFWEDEKQLVTKIASVDLKKQIDAKMQEFKTEQEAIAHFGENVHVTEARKCSMYEYQAWLETINKPSV